jgi:periplasmic copper chaperone A
MMNLTTFARRSPLLLGLLALAAITTIACADDAEEAEEADHATPMAQPMTQPVTQPMAEAGAITVVDAWARETAGNPGENSAIYALITNATDQDDVLVAVLLPEGVAEATEIHEMVPAGANMMMQEIEGGLPVPAGETAVLEPGGYHVMLMGVIERLVAGEHFHATFVFEHAGELEVEIDIREAGAMGGGMGSGH